MTVGVTIWTGFSPMLLARDLGYYDNASIRLVELAASSQVMDAMRVGKLDVAAISLEDAVTLIKEGIPLSIVQVLSDSDGADVVLGHANVTTLNDLKNKRIGVEKTTIGSYMLKNLLAAADIEMADVKVILLDFNEQYNAWLDHEVDVLITYEPLRTRLLKEGAEVLFDSTDIATTLVGVLVVRKNISQPYSPRYKSQLTSLIQGHERALEYLNRHPRDAISQIALRTQSSLEEIEQSLFNIHIPRLSQQKIYFSQETKNKSLYQQLIRALPAVEARLVIDGQFIQGVR